MYIFQQHVNSKVINSTTTSAALPFVVNLQQHPTPKRHTVPLEPAEIKFPFRRQLAKINIDIGVTLLIFAQ